MGNTPGGLQERAYDREWPSGVRALSMAVSITSDTPHRSHQHRPGIRNPGRVLVSVPRHDERSRRQDQIIDRHCPTFGRVQRVVKGDDSLRLVIV